MCLTIDEMLAKLQSLGVTKKFLPIWDNETETICLKVRKEIAIDEQGHLKGSQIILNRDGNFVVWTPKKKKAMALARERGLRIKGYDGEAEFVVPAALADELLHSWGAKVRRNMSPEVAEAARVRMLRRWGKEPGESIKQL